MKMKHCTQRTRGPRFSNFARKRNMSRIRSTSKVAKSSKSVIMRRRDKTRVRKTSSLVDLCVKKALNNVRYLGNLGPVDDHLLERILPHCTVDQLMHIEKASKGIDLSPVTDKLWKNFFRKRFGTNCTNEVIERMSKKRVSFRWMQLYEVQEVSNLFTHPSQSNLFRLGELEFSTFENWDCSQ